MAESPLIAVTGANGFVGGALYRSLQQAGFRVVPLVRSLEHAAELDSPVPVGHIDTNTQWTKALQGVQCVIHCAARVHVMNDQSLDPLAEFRKVNTAGTQALAEQAAACGVKRLVFVSTVKVMGERTEPGKPFQASDSPAPLDPYSQSKWEAELALQAVSLETGMEITIVRPPLVYGPGVGGNFEQLLRLVGKGLPLPLGAIRNRRSLIALDNLAHLLTICATHPQAANETFLVSDGWAPSTTELIRAVAVAQKRKARLWPVPPRILRLAGQLTGRLAQIERLTDSLEVDDRKTRHLLDWQPPITFEEGIQRTLRTNTI